MTKIEIQKSDAEKILDSLKEAKCFFETRDKMNAQIHLAKDVRKSEITTTLITAHDRLEKILNE